MGMDTSLDIDARVTALDDLEMVCTYFTAIHKSDFQIHLII